MTAPKETLDVSIKEMELKQYYDPNYVRSANTHLMDTIANDYFRTKFVGFDANEERVRPDRPLIYASNHSGMAFPWDAIIFASQTLKAQNYELRRMPRALAAPMLSHTRITAPYLLPNFWKRCGCVDATTDNFETMMESGDSDVLIYPEGVPGIAKGFNNKYQLQRFSSSFVRMAIKHQTDIIPISTVNAEYINPWAYSSQAVNRLMNKLSIPFLPLGPILIPLLLFPWMFYFGFPAKLTYVIGRRIKPHEWVNKPFEKITLGEFRAIADKVRGLMQEDLNQAVADHGKKPYKIHEVLAKLLRKPSLIWRISPPFWPSLFYAHERAYYKNPGHEAKLKPGLLCIIKSLFQTRFSLIFLIPLLGWIPVLWTGSKRNLPTLEAKNRS